MAHKVKDIIESYIYEIRAEQKLTQEELGELLGVSVRMIQSYEAGQTTLPLDKAMYLCEKWNYSLDQIYRDFSKKPIFNKFSVDIRDFLSISKESIVFTLPDYYWEYLQKVEKINEDDFLESEKKRLIKKLEAKYTGKTHCVIWKADIPIDAFLSFIKFWKEEIPFGSEEPETIYVEPTDEQIKVATNFLNKITKGEHE